MGYINLSKVIRVGGEKDKIVVWFDPEDSLELASWIVAG